MCAKTRYYSFFQEYNLVCNTDTAKPVRNQNDEFYDNIIWVYPIIQRNGIYDFGRK